jgi:8-oxo-dGTP diphosphatase
MPNTDPEVDQSIHVVAALIRHPDEPDKICITQRKSGQHLENLWEFPGGKVEQGESAFHALKRELFEELGIELHSAQPFQSVRHRYPDKSILLDVWRVKSYSGQAHGRENQNCQWVSISDLQDYEFPEADIPVLKALDLPPELLITPDVSLVHQDSFLQQFERVMDSHPYKLVLFRSPQLEDKQYAEIAQLMEQIAKPHKASIIIHRNKLKSLQHKSFDSFGYRHLNSYLLNSLTARPFDDSIVLSASCHDQTELKLAERFECKFAMLSTVRETTSHPGRRAKGWYGFNQLATRSSLPIYALGGIKREDYCVASFQGAVGVAGISDFWSA